MSIRFKFRSSPNYDSVDIGGLPSISIRELKSRIVENLKLNICQDSDLIFSDPTSGQEYLDEDFQISCGSSVIVKRVPARTPVGSLKKFATANTTISKTSDPNNVETVNFDDFGADLCPVAVANLSGYDQNVKNNFCFCDDDMTNKKLKSSSDQVVEECYKFEASGISEAVRQDQNLLDAKYKPDADHNKKFSNFVEVDGVVVASFPVMQTADFPLELKCPLCGMFFKEAVMIPCCHSSFCEKCIHHVLVEKAKCPKCLSTKCRVEDLLPNLSLRQAIEPFIKEQFLIDGSENALNQYAPADEESGVNVKDVSCAVSVFQRGAESPPCPSSTGRGSNQVPAEPFCATRSGGNPNHVLKDRISKFPVCKMQHLPEYGEGFDDFQGENQPINDEVESNVKRIGALWLDASDADKIGMEGRPKKGDRACYICGSPDHLRRDCPAAYSPYSMLQRGNAMFPEAMPGYASACWNGPPFPHIRPFANLYGNSGIMPFNTAAISAAPFPVPTYMPYIFGGSSTFGAYTRMGAMADAVRNNVEHKLLHSDRDLDYDNRDQFRNENVMRTHHDEFDAKRYLYGEVERPCDRRFYPDKERSASFSEDGFTKKSHMKRWHPRNNYDNDNVFSEDESHQVSGQNQRPYHQLEGSRSEVDDMPSCSSRHFEESHERVHWSSKKYGVQREYCNSGSSRNHYPMTEKDNKRETDGPNAERWHKKHYTHSESSIDQKRERMKKTSIRSSTHSGHRSKPTRDDRWQMTRRSDEDNEEDYYYHKRRRVY